MISFFTIEVLMLEKYYVRPETCDRVRSLWIGPLIEQYVIWLDERRYERVSTTRRISILVHFSEFTQSRGVADFKDLPEHVEPFVQTWISEHVSRRTSQLRRKKMGCDVRNPIRQMLRLAIPGYVGLGKTCQPSNPFENCAPRFFEYLKDEKGLSYRTIDVYRYYLRKFSAYLNKIGMKNIRHLSPSILSGLVTEYRHGIEWSALRNACGGIRVFLRYLYRENILAKDLSHLIESPQSYRLSVIPRSIDWGQVQQILESIDRRSSTGKRNYAILLLLSMYGLRAREIVAMTLDDIDWRNNRMKIPERKAGHSTAYPLSLIVGEAILDYLKNARPQTHSRHIFFRIQAPIAPISGGAISALCRKYLSKMKIKVPCAGSHTFRHSCVQKLVNANFSLKQIGDYIGHRDPASTQIYGKVAVEDLRTVALGDGEEVLS
jgi:integrase/recombinase XerD